MGKPPFGLLLSVTIIVGLSGGRSILVGAERVDVFPLVLIVHDRANVFPATLDQALKEAARIYRQAGISTEWLPATGSAANVGLPSPRAFTVQLIIQAKLRAEHDRPSKFVMGAAPKTTRDCAGMVYVFYDQITGFSNVHQIDSGLAMGTVIAHEVGHVLLNKEGHSAEGLMRATWDSNDWQRAAQGFLLFSFDDTETIRATTSSCRL